MTQDLENSFPFNRHAPEELADDKYDTMIAVLNGVQRNIMMLAQKIDVIEHRLNDLEKQNVE